MMKTKKFILSMMNFKKHLAIAAALLLSLTMTTQAKIYTWDKYNIAFEAPEGGQVPFSFFQDPNSAQVEWDEMVMTLQRYIKNENTNKKNLNERLKSRALGFNMYDTKLLEIKVKGFKCYSLEGTMPDGTRCLINYLVSDKTSTVLEVVINYLLGNQEVVEDIIKSFSENNNQKPNERDPSRKFKRKKTPKSKNKNSSEKNDAKTRKPTSANHLFFNEQSAIKRKTF